MESSVQGLSVSRKSFLLRIVVSHENGRTGEEIRVAFGDQVTIGRDPGCGVVLADESVSRRHARLELTPDGIRIVDLGSGNGVWVDARRVTDVVVGAGQRVRIGSTVLECFEEVSSFAAAALDAPTMIVGRAAIDVDSLLAISTFVLRVVEGGEIVQRGQEFVVNGREATVGRGKDCTVVVEERDVSRRSAQIEIVPGGFLVTDLGGSAGVWIGGRRIASEIVLPGTPIRLGPRLTLEVHTTKSAPESTPKPEHVPQEEATQFVSAAELERLRASVAPPVAPVPPESLEDPRNPGNFVQQDSTQFVPAAEMGRFRGSSTAPPAAPESDSAVEHDATQFIPAVELERFKPGDAAHPDAPAFHVADLTDSTQFVPADEMARFRASEAFSTAASAFPESPEAAVTDADFGHTVHIPAVQIPASTRSIEDAGELMDVSAHEPFLADDPEAAWLVVSGGILLFTVAVEKGEPVGTRTHFLGIVPGQCFFGFDLQRYGVGSGFLAVAKQGTSVRKLKVAELQELAKDGAQAPTVAGLLDTWVRGLSKALIQGLPIKRTGEMPLTSGQRIEIDSTVKVTSPDGVVWLDVWSGSLLFDDMATPVFARKRALFPVTPDSWVQSISDEFGTLSVTPASTAERLNDDAVWYGLDVFHQVLCECQFINKKLATVDEYVRLGQKAQDREAAKEAAYDAIGSVMRNLSSAPQEFLASTSAEPVYRACALVGHHLGLNVKEHPSAEDVLNYEERVAAIASASGFRTRVVALRGDWWTEDHGPVMAQMAATKEAVALLPLGAGAYERVDPKTRERTKVTAANAEDLTPFAISFYRPFPDGDLGVRDVIKFGMKGMSRDFRLVLAMAIIVGMCGTVTPYFTGRIFDEAVPQAEKGQLAVYGVALLAFAIAMAAFKFVQGVATVRIQTRMSSAIQSAVWDRIMNLPVNFFRKYSAGDLADRAEGVDAIQELVSGAGVAAILGSVSGIFYVGQMFGYDLKLAGLAVALTLTFVGFNMTANYLQLRYQRQEMQLRGIITGLVLNLLTGVSKLRICGSELHAFRVWAERFSRQRRISFTIGNIQAAAAVFTTVFPILSNILIFYVMIGQQERAAPGGSTMTTGDFIAFTAAYGLFMAAMQSLGDASLNLLRVVPIYERLKPILDCKPEVDPTKAFPGKLNGEIELSHLNFRYDVDGPWIIKDLSLKIKAGEFVAFVGGSGCGKSTLMRLMLGFEVPSSGTLSFDGQDLSQLDLRMVRQQMGVVLQVSRLMPTEIYRNIIGVGSKTIEDAWWAAERAGLADDIRGMPMGMHTYVSEGGGTLSGGQRQRLMIARAIVNKPKILFLDEATSALDNRSQAIVTESMDKMDATRIVIAHRLSTIINANKICYMESGRIAEMGTYQELMDKDGLFAQLAKRQMA